MGVNNMLMPFRYLIKKPQQGETMILNAIYFALCFMLILLGLIIAIHFNFWIGMSMMILFTIKFMLQLPNNEGV